METLLDARVASLPVGSTLLDALQLARMDTDGQLSTIDTFVSQTLVSHLPNRSAGDKSRAANVVKQKLYNDSLSNLLLETQQCLIQMKSTPPPSVGPASYDLQPSAQYPWCSLELQYVSHAIMHPLQNFTIHEPYTFMDGTIFLSTSPLSGTNPTKKEMKDELKQTVGVYWWPGTIMESVSVTKLMQCGRRAQIKPLYVGNFNGQTIDLSMNMQVQPVDPTGSQSRFTYRTGIEDGLSDTMLKRFVDMLSLNPVDSPNQPLQMAVYARLLSPVSIQRDTVPGAPLDRLLVRRADTDITNVLMMLEQFQMLPSMNRRSTV